MRAATYTTRPALIISTSAADDTNTFSRWLDDPPPGAYVQEHRPPFGLPADDLESLLLANPGDAALDIVLPAGRWQPLLCSAGAASAGRATVAAHRPMAKLSG